MLEILAPAGNIECAKIAVQAGADAVYVGYTAFSARQSADNFDLPTLQAFIREAHVFGVKVYVAFNTLVKDTETDLFIRSIIDVWNIGADAIIMQDILLGKYVKQNYPAIVLHASTQAGTCNENGAKFIKNCGFSRVILARETPLDEICKITKIIETEVFVQGALCTCFSGQCYFSSFVGGNSGNRGRCKQPCRKTYAYNRNGNTEYSYALSLSDLCVGSDIQKYIDAGVVSFKIEGRMRRSEYVSASVQYYRAILDGAQSDNKLSALKRTYNRGNYTKGLAFGQDKRLLSTAVQGHIGEKIGVVKVLNGKYIVETPFVPRIGDGFKILRNGVEVGGAYLDKKENKGFSLRSKTRLKNGDGVFITTDTELNEKLTSVVRNKPIYRVSLYFAENERPVAECSDVRLVGEKRLQTAQNRPLSQDELTTCFSKTDNLPIEIAFEKICVAGNIFIAKSELNAFRRTFFSELEKKFVGERKQERYSSSDMPTYTGKNTKTAVLSDDFHGVETDIGVYKPNAYNGILPDTFIHGKFEKFIYYPAFCTSEDEARLQIWIEQYRLGVYAESYAGVQFARQHQVPLFIGTGLNVTNKVARNGWIEEQATYIALSKELHENEIENLSCEKTFALSSGDIKLMDLCYCPFGKTCTNCDKQTTYILTDENGRAFPVRRYLSANGACRFEVFNCASLVSRGITNTGKLIDVSVCKDKVKAVQAKESEEAQKRVYAKYTSGHLNRGVL